MKTHKILVTVIFLVIWNYPGTNHLLPKKTLSIITFFIKSQPELKPERIDKLLQTPGKLARHYIKKNISKLYVSGIYVTYAGFITASDVNGQVLLPRKSKHENICLIITPMIQPVLLKNNTVHHFILNPKEKAAIYTLTRKHEKTYTYWEIEKAHLSKNNIPWNAIIVFAQPDSLMLPTGHFVTDNSPNLVLPPLLSSKFVYDSTEALRLLKINHYFSPVLLTYQFTNDRYATMIKH